MLKQEKLVKLGLFKSNPWFYVYKQAFNMGMWATALLMIYLSDSFVVHFVEEEREDLMPGIFRRMFESSKKLLKVSTSLVDEHGSVPDQYSEAYMRAKWPSGGFKLTGWEQGKGEVMMDDKKVYDLLTSIADNTINCVVEAMKETKFVYFASDSYHAL